MKLSAGVLIQDSITKRILGCKTTDWPTQDCYDVPKGNVNEGENPLHAAVRELYEETNLKLNKDEIERMYSLGTFHFVPTPGTLDFEKDIQLFYLQKSMIPILSRLHCRSYYIVEGKKKREVNGYKLISEDDLSLFYKAFQPVLQQFLVNIKS